MHKKEKTDSQRAKIFTKIGKEMAVAVREGGPDPVSNSKLKDLIAKAKSNNVPNDNIERIIKKAAGETGGAKYEEITYEGYGPSGVAIIVEAATDNRNRTGADLRHYFDKFGGNLGQSGCVSYMFSEKGVIIIESKGIDEDKLMDDALTAGAEDILSEGDVFEIYTAPEDFSAVREYLENAGYTFVSCEKDKIPANYVSLSDPDDIVKMGRLLEMLEDNDDVINIYHNYESEEE